MNIKPIKSKTDYERALARLDELMDAEFGSERGDELEVLATLIEAYEKKKGSSRISGAKPFGSLSVVV